MLKIIQNLENHNNNLIDISGYMKFVGERLIPETATEEEFQKVICEAFVRFSKVKNVQKHYKNLLLNNADFLRLYKEAPSEIKSQILNMYCLCRMTNDWLEYKQIYKFDKDTLELLSETEQDISNELLEKLNIPYGCFVIENDFKVSDGIIDSVIIKRTKQENAIEYAFYLFYAEQKNLYKHLFLKFDTSQGELKDFLKNHISDESVKKFYITIFNLIMYLSQPKVEILRKKSEIKERKHIKHFYSLSVNENEVGYSLGNAIRNYKIIYEKKERGEKTGRTVRPHMRRGHFQHYWIGEGRKEVIVKYINPTFIKGGNNKATVHKVK